MPGRFSAPPLAALLDAGAEVVCVAVPAPPGAPPLARLPPTPAPAGLLPLAGAAPPNILQIAAAHAIPALALGRPAGAAALAALAALRPDLACVACWPWRIPPALLGLPRHGFLNVHPSLLPDLRGPEPIFWALRAGAERVGATVHLMDPGLDTGDIVAQGGADLAAGAGWEEVEGRAAALGGRLLAEAVGLLAAGRMPRRPQGPGGGYRPAPRADDFAIDQAWPARRAFIFMRGTAAWGFPYRIHTGSEVLALAEALDYTEEGDLDQPYIRNSDLISIQMTPGVLRAKVKGKR
nr:formyltransferase family protein [Oscillochloris sp. ZM17-4]